MFDRHWTAAQRPMSSQKAGRIPGYEKYASRRSLNTWLPTSLRLFAEATNLLHYFGSTSALYDQLAIFLVHSHSSRRVRQGVMVDHHLSTMFCLGRLLFTASRTVSNATKVTGCYCREPLGTPLRTYPLTRSEVTSRASSSGHRGHE